MHPEVFDGIDGPDAWAKVDQRLEAALAELMQRPPDRRSRDEIKRLGRCIARSVTLFVSMDPYQRPASYVLPIVPCSITRQQFLRYAWSVDASLGRGIVGDYCAANHIPPRRRAKPKTKPKRKPRSKAKPATRPRPPADRSRTCPRCDQPTLAHKVVRSSRDPHTDSWTDDSMWRCSGCRWRQVVEHASSERPRTAPPRRPDEDLGDPLRRELRTRLARRRPPGPRVLRREGARLEQLLQTEREVDRQLAVPGARQRRALEDEELSWLTLLFPRFPGTYAGETRAHWDKMLRAQARRDWPREDLRRFAASHPRFDPTLADAPPSRCPTCLRERASHTEIVDADVTTPNELDLRPRRVTRYYCRHCAALGG